MKDLKFRVWDKKTKRYWKQKEMSEIGGFYYTYGVDPDENEFDLQQYTGLKDKNGKEIYEGDIAKGVSSLFEFKKGIVKFHSGMFSLGNDHEGSALDSCWDVEVIGNIYENKNLLNGTTNNNT